MKYVIKVELWSVASDNRVWFEQSEELSSSAPLRVWRAAVLKLLASLYDVIRARLT